MIDTQKRRVVVGDQDGWWDETDPNLGVWCCSRCGRKLAFSPNSMREDVEDAVRAHVQKYCEGAR